MHQNKHYCIFIIIKLVILVNYVCKILNFYTIKRKITGCKVEFIVSILGSKKSFSAIIIDAEEIDFFMKLSSCFL